MIKTQSYTFNTHRVKVLCVHFVSIGLTMLDISSYYITHCHPYTSYVYSVIVRGCDFQFDANQISLGSSLSKAVVTGNIITVRQCPAKLPFNLQCSFHH